MRKRARAHTRTGAPSVRGALWRFAVPLCVGAAVPARICAQDDPAIRSAVQLATEGRGDSARRMVASVLAGARPGDSGFVEALYWRGRLATWGDSAERDLRRVALEFSTSRWADDALLQLTQLAVVAGNPASARALAERIRSDYPGSDLRARAAFWAGRAALEMDDVPGGCAELDSARTEAPDDIEFQNQLRYHRTRCPAARPAAPDPPSAPPVPATAAPLQPDTATPAPAASFLVQVAASRSDGQIRRFVDLVTRGGFPARVVPGPGGYRRVRIGPFSTLREAEAAARQAKRMVGGEPYVVREP